MLGGEELQSSTCQSIGTEHTLVRVGRSSRRLLPGKLENCQSSSYLRANYLDELDLKCACTSRPVYAQPCIYPARASAVLR